MGWRRAPTLSGDQMRNISYSELSTFQQCARKHWYVYGLGRVPAVTEDRMRFGTLMHEVTAAWWIGGEEAAAAPLVAVADQMGMVEAAKAAAMVRAYHPPRDEFEVLGIEVPFEVPLRAGRERAMHGIRIHGFADAILREKATGRLIVREYKTTTSTIIGYGPYWARLAIDTQVALYHLAFQADAVVYDVSRVPQLRPSRADGLKNGEEPSVEVCEAYRDRLFGVVDELPEDWHQWRPQWKTEADLYAAAMDIEARVRMLRHAERTALVPMSPGACATKFGVCPYIDVCAMRADIDDETRFVDRKGR